MLRSLPAAFLFAAFSVLARRPDNSALSKSLTYQLDLWGVTSGSLKSRPCCKVYTGYNFRFDALRLYDKNGSALMVDLMSIRRRCCRTVSAVALYPKLAFTSEKANSTESVDNDRVHSDFS